MLKNTTAPDRVRPPMSQVALSLPDDVIALIEKRARLRFQDRAQHLRELIITSLVDKGVIKVSVDD